jgi:hypothetical protein
MNHLNALVYDSHEVAELKNHARMILNESHHT